MAGRWAGVGRWLRAEAAVVLVLLALIGCVVFLLFNRGHWRMGSAGIAATVLFAGLIRAALPGRLVGVLAIRGRIVDTLFLALTGGVILAVAIRLH